MSTTVAASIAGVATASTVPRTASVPSSNVEPTVVVPLSVVSWVVPDIAPDPNRPPSFPKMAMPHSCKFCPALGFQPGIRARGLPNCTALPRPEL
jgi:hypothetical protein